MLSRLWHSLSFRERQFAVSAGFVFFVSFIFLILSWWYGTAKAQPASGGIFKEGVIGQPVYINPILASSDVDLDLVELLFADLKDLIESKESNDDKTSWVINLKDNLKWSDGSNITSDDVVFTIKAIQDPDTRSPLFPKWQGVAAERLSEKQFRLSLKIPYAFFEENINSLKIIPKHIFGEIPPSNWRLSNFNLEPVGTGPYKFARFNKRKNGFIATYEMSRNKLFAGSKPYIDEIHFVFFSDKKDLIRAFNKKHVDGIGGLAVKDFKAITVRHKIAQAYIPNYYAIFFNPAFSEAMRDKDVRTALALAIDKKRLVNEVFDGGAMVVDGPLVPFISGFDKEVYKDEKFDLEKAKELIGDKELSFEIVVPEVDFLVQTIDLIKENWQKIGVELKPIILPPRDVSTNVIRSRNYQMLIFGTILAPNADIFSFWHSSERFYPGSNLALFEDKQVDDWLEAIKTELDLKKRSELISKVQKKILDERPAVFLYSPVYFYVATPKLKGLEMMFIPTKAKRFDNVEKWHLREKRSLW